MYSEPCFMVILHPDTGTIRQWKRLLISQLQTCAISWVFIRFPWKLAQFEGQELNFYVPALLYYYLICVWRIYTFPEDIIFTYFTWKGGSVVQYTAHTLRTLFTHIANLVCRFSLDIFSPVFIMFYACFSWQHTHTNNILSSCYTYLVMRESAFHAHLLCCFCCVAVLNMFLVTSY